MVLGLTAVLAAGATCGPSGTPSTTTDEGKAAVPPKAQARAEFHLYAFAQIAGTIAPCGCTTEPLGGLQYAFGYIEEHSDPKARLVLEPGSFLYPVKDGPFWPEDEAAWSQADDRAALLHTRFNELGAQLVSGIGPTDVVSPKGSAPLSTFPMPRVVSNVKMGAEQSLPKHRVVELSSEGIAWKVGVTAAVDPSLAGAGALGEVVAAESAVTATIASMKSEGAEFSIVLAQGDRAFAESLAGTGADLVIVGIPEGPDRERLGTPASRRGDAFILEPGTQLQTVTELVVSIDPAGGKVPSIAAWTIPETRSTLEQELARVEERLTKFKADPDADAAFLSNLEAQKADLVKRLASKPQGPAVGMFDQVKVTCKLPPDEPAKAALAKYDQTVAAQNKARFTGVRPPEPEQGVSGYAGIEACSDCHQEAVDFWETTVHASAYETLVVDNKQFDLSCVGCHVTGFREPGGSEVVENTGLVDVQCEVCHGPGALHAEDGGEDLGLIELHAPAKLCAGECHTQEHSDTFEYDAYLRDILGEGHGHAKRKLLGDGPTGHDLRQAGLAKAGGACKKM